MDDFAQFLAGNRIRTGDKQDTKVKCEWFSRVETWLWFSDPPVDRNTLQARHLALYAIKYLFVG